MKIDRSMNQQAPSAFRSFGPWLFFGFGWFGDFPPYYHDPLPFFGTLRSLPSAAAPATLPSTGRPQSVSGRAAGDLFPPPAWSTSTGLPAELVRGEPTVSFAASFQRPPAGPAAHHAAPTVVARAARPPSTPTATTSFARDLAPASARGFLGEGNPTLAGSLLGSVPGGFGVQIGTGSLAVQSRHATRAPASVSSPASTAWGTLPIITDDGNPLTPDIFVRAGQTLTLTGGNQIGDTAGIVIEPGGTVTVGPGALETIGTLRNNGGTFLAGEGGQLIATGNTITWASGTNTILNGATSSDSHWSVSGGVNTVNGGATGGTLQVATGGLGLEFDGTASPTITLNSDAAVGGRILLQGNVTVLPSLTAGTAQILSGGVAANPGFIDLGAGTRTFTVNDGSAATDLLISAKIQNGGLVKNGAGTLTLSGANSFTGNLTLSAGTLRAQGNAANLGAGASVLNLNGGTLELVNDGSLNYGRNVVIGGNVNTMVDRIISAATQVTMTFGTLQIGAYTLTYSRGANITGANAGNLNFGATTLTGNAVIDNGSFATISLSGVTDGASSFGLSKTGAGTLVINGSSTFDGNLTVNGGIVRLAAANAGGQGDIVVLGTTAVQLSGVNALNAASANDWDHTTAGTLTVGLVRDGASIFNTGTITVGSGLALTLEANRSSTGNNLTHTLNASGITFSSSGTLNATGVNGFDVKIDSASGGITTTSGTLTISPTSADLEIADVISGGAGVTISGTTGTPVLLLSAANTYSGDTLITHRTGIVRMAITNALPSGATKGNFSMAPGAGTATFDLNGFNQTLNGFSSSGAGASVVDNVAAGTATLTIGDNNGTGTFSGTIQDTGGDLSLIKIGSGTITIGGTSTYAGTTTVSGGTLELSATGALGGTASVTVNGGTLLLSGAAGNRINNAASMTLAGGTFNTGGLSETLGALTLSGNSIIDFAGGDSILNFANSSGASWDSTKTLSIWNWGGSTAGGGNDQLKFGSDSTALTSGQLAQISFFSGAGSGFLGTGQFVGSLGEVVPVPEPSSVLIGLAMCGLAGWRERRRLLNNRVASRRRFPISCGWE